MKAVILDWDGTLADSHTVIFEANAEVMRAFGLPWSQERYRQHYTPDWRLMYRRLGIAPDRFAEATRIWEAAFHRGAPTALLPGAGHAVERLHAAGLPLGVVTSGGRELVEPQLRRLGLLSFIDVRVYGDEQAEQKPDPRPLLRALEELGIAKSDRRDVAYLGDATEDMAMAVAAGVRPVGVVSPYSDRDALAQAGAAEVVDSVAEWVARHVAAPGEAVHAGRSRNAEDRRH